MTSLVTIVDTPTVPRVRFIEPVLVLLQLQTMTEVITELEADGGEDSALFGEDIYSATSLLLGEDSPGKKEVSLADNLPSKCVSFHNISYHVKQRRFFKKLPPKTILHNIR